MAVSNGKLHFRFLAGQLAFSKTGTLGRLAGLSGFRTQAPRFLGNLGASPRRTWLTALGCYFEIKSEFLLLEKLGFGKVDV